MAESVQKVKVRDMKAAIVHLKDQPKSYVNIKASDLWLVLECAERGLPPDPVDPPAPTPEPNEPAQEA